MKSDRPIVLVEDNPDDVELTLRAFRKSKIANEVLVARDGQEALELLLGSESRPPVRAAFVLLDLKLPKIDGIEVLRKLRASESARFTPVVVLTSSNEDRDIVESYALGANSYIRKPVDFMQFADAAQQLGLYWLVLNEPPKE
ncbi:MAG TPA: response regulator [Thermoanaerobaculia bacterium]|jgi:two-component system response regulator